MDLLANVLVCRLLRSLAFDFLESVEGLEVETEVLQCLGLDVGVLATGRLRSHIRMVVMSGKARFDTVLAHLCCPFLQIAVDFPRTQHTRRVEGRQL